MAQSRLHLKQKKTSSIFKISSVCTEKRLIFICQISRRGGKSRKTVCEMVTRNPIHTDKIAWVNWLCGAFALIWCDTRYKAQLQRPVLTLLKVWIFNPNSQKRKLYTWPGLRTREKFCMQVSLVHDYFFKGFFQ